MPCVVCATGGGCGYQALEAVQVQEAPLSLVHWRHFRLSMFILSYCKPFVFKSWRLHIGNHFYLTYWMKSMEEFGHQYKVEGYAYNYNLRDTLAQVNILTDRYFELIKDDRCTYCVALPGNLVAGGGHKSSVCDVFVWYRRVSTIGVRSYTLWEKSEIFVFISLTRFAPHRDSFTN